MFITKRCTKGPSRAAFKVKINFGEKQNVWVNGLHQLFQCSDLLVFVALYIAQQDPRPFTGEFRMKCRHAKSLRSTYEGTKQ
jgi:hypothetical protein